MKNYYLSYSVMFLAVIGLFLMNLVFGAVDIPIGNVISILVDPHQVKSSWAYIILESRLPQAITAILAGSALAVCGLMLQTVFRNPLADPSILGISSGAGIGVAVAIFLLGGTVSFGGYYVIGFFAIFVAAFIGAMLVMAIILMFALILRNNILLLIVGIMIGYLASSITSLLNFFAAEEGVKSYAVWGMGDFSGVTMHQIPLLAILILCGLMCAFILVKPLNLLLLGERYAANLGTNIMRVRNLLLIITGGLTAVVTAVCGPVSFIGLAVPHIARMIVSTSDHRILMPCTALMGAIVTLLCNLFCTLPHNGAIVPINAITPIIGVPVIIYVIMKNKH